MEDNQKPISKDTIVYPDIEPQYIQTQRVKIEKCHPDFFYQNSTKSYKMFKNPRGQCLIVNIYQIHEMPPRRWSEKDTMMLKQLFEELMFQVHVYTDSTHDLSANNLKQIIHEFSKLRQHEDAQCCVVCLMSHGEEGYLTSKEGGKLLLDDIFSLFSNINCPHLAGKPKLFFIQSCRDDPVLGPTEDHGIHVNLSRAQINANLIDREHTDGLTANQTHVKNTSKPNSYHMPTLCDILVGFPTQKGFIAYRKPEIGSWYMNAIVQVFSKHAKNTDVCAMLNMVNSMISQEVTNSGKKQMSEYTSNFTKPYLYFYPGLCISSEAKNEGFINLRKENSLLDILIQTRPIKRARNDNSDFIVNKTTQENVNNNCVQLRKTFEKSSIFNFQACNAENMIFKPNLSLINKRACEAECVTTEKLNYKEILTHKHKMFIAEKANNYWKEIAREMDLEEAQIRNIDASIDTKESANKLYEVINLWIIKKGHTHANLTSLIQVLSNLNLNAIKEDFIENIQAKNFPHILEE